MITISDNIDIEKLKRLQQYAKLFAFSLRFLECYESFGKWYVKYEVNAEDYDKINSGEYIIELMEEDERKDKIKAEWKNMNIFKKAKKIFVDFLNSL